MVVLVPLFVIQSITTRQLYSLQIGNSKQIGALNRLLVPEPIPYIPLLCIAVHSLSDWGVAECMRSLVLHGVTLTGSPRVESIYEAALFFRAAWKNACEIAYPQLVHDSQGSRVSFRAEGSARGHVPVLALRVRAQGQDASKVRRPRRGQLMQATHTT
jgi:hypothetical protein